MEYSSRLANIDLRWLPHIFCVARLSVAETNIRPHVRH